MYQDSKYINKDTYLSFCNSNETLIEKPICGYVLEFPGLGGGSCLGGSMDMGVHQSNLARKLAEQGILHLYMFTGPWSWMNKGAVRLVDAVVDAIYDKFGLSDDTPSLVCGGSMGGMGSLIYAADTRHHPKACLSMCPCVNVPERMYAHPEFVRTCIRAVLDYNMELEDGLKSISPVHRIADMPKIPYMIINDCADEVFPEELMDNYVADMRADGHSIVYDKLPGCIHGEIPAAEWERIIAFSLDMVLKGQKTDLTDAVVPKDN